MRRARQRDVQAFFLEKVKANSLTTNSHSITGEPHPYISSTPHEITSSSHGRMEEEAVYEEYEQKKMKKQLGEFGANTQVCHSYIPASAVLRRIKTQKENLKKESHGQYQQHQSRKEQQKQCQQTLNASDSDERQVRAEPVNQSTAKRSSTAKRASMIIAPSLSICPQKISKRSTCSTYGLAQIAIISIIAKRFELKSRFIYPLKAHAASATRNPLTRSKNPSFQIAISVCSRSSRTSSSLFFFNYIRHVHRAYTRIRSQTRRIQGYRFESAPRTYICTVLQRDSYLT
ncbi:unnamed protein product [Trichogramma brassicae]|uniref:Uncharacterized protein n=1 Tax=Trichogramma brassicae TaxID=86971 RepID=A0A6H5IQ07_9HYME|nr:unnamed protein product [Trichogramma brassicae]